MKTYNDIYIEARKKLKEAGIEAYSLEARLLLAYVADKSTDDFLRDIRLYPGDDYQQRADMIIERRLNGEPAAYITGEWEFYGLGFEINSNVLIPRMDTELAVDCALKYLKATEKPRVLDLCSGSGCIGIAVAVSAQSASVVLADLDRRALLLSKRNVQRHRLGGRVLCVEADALKPAPARLGGFDMIVCNPPYIPTAEIAALDSSVKDFEPHSALDGGDDGMDFYRSVCSHWQSAITPGGLLIFECGEGQSGEIVRLASGMGYTHLESVRDTLDIERTLVFKLG